MAPPNDPLVGTVFDDRYEVVSRIGEGGMGVVYKARQIAMNRMVALKVVHPDHHADEAVMKRFFREMKATSRIEHPNTIRVYDFGKAKDGNFFLAMELLDGLALEDEVRKGALPVARALPIAVQILKGLAAAHAEGVVHRDLKPDNIMLLSVYGEQDQVRVLDFGIAIIAPNADESTNLRVTASGIMMGTPSYISPEQIGGEEVDARSDLYSFGVVLYEMVTGELPFHDPDRPLRVLQLHMTETPKTPSSVGALPIPPWLDDLLMKLLAKYPDDRPASAEEVITILERQGRAPTPVPAIPIGHRTGAAPAPATRGASSALVFVWVLLIAVAFGLGGMLIGVVMAKF